MSIVKLISLSLKKQSTMHVITFYFRNLKIRKSKDNWHTFSPLLKVWVISWIHTFLYLSFFLDKNGICPFLKLS